MGLWPFTSIRYWGPLKTGIPYSGESGTGQSVPAEGFNAGPDLVAEREERRPRPVCGFARVAR